MNAQNSGWALDFPRMSSQTSELFEHSKVFGVFQQPAKWGISIGLHNQTTGVRIPAIKRLEFGAGGVVTIIKRREVSSSLSDPNNPLLRVDAEMNSKDHRC
jgi:hypothetical protein